MRAAIKGPVLTYPKPEKPVMTSSWRRYSHAVGTTLWSIAVASSAYALIWWSFLKGH